MAWPFLLYFLAWFTNESVFFTSRTPPLPFWPISTPHSLSQLLLELF